MGRTWWKRKGREVQRQRLERVRERRAESRSLGNQLSFPAKPRGRGRTSASDAGPRASRTPVGRRGAALACAPRYPHGGCTHIEHAHVLSLSSCTCVRTCTRMRGWLRVCVQAYAWLRVRASACVAACAWLRVRACERACALVAIWQAVLQKPCSAIACCSPK